MQVWGLYILTNKQANLQTGAAYCVCWLQYAFGIFLMQKCENYIILVHTHMLVLILGKIAWNQSSE